MLKARYPGLRVVGAYSPPMGFGADEDQKVVEMIRAAKPDMLFVAFGRRSRTLDRGAQPRPGVPIAVGVGGVFNFLIGRVRRAPRLDANKTGLEWFYRVLQ